VTSSLTSNTYELHRSLPENDTLFICHFSLYVNIPEHKGHKEIQEKHPCLSVFMRGWKTFLQAIHYGSAEKPNFLAKVTGNPRCKSARKIRLLPILMIAQSAGLHRPQDQCICYCG
jgi:hypothetical protein